MIEGTEGYFSNAQARQEGWKTVLFQCGVAHLDQDRTNNRFSNLAFLCRACHLNWNRMYNIGKSLITRKYGKDRRQLRIPFQLYLPIRVSLPASDAR